MGLAFKQIHSFNFYKRFLGEKLFKLNKLIETKFKIRMQIQTPPAGLKQVIAILGSVKDRKVPENAIQVRLVRESSDKPTT